MTKVTTIVCGAWLASAMGCSDLSGLTGRQAFPAGVQDPNTYHTAAGARALYANVLAEFGYTTYSRISSGSDTTGGVGNKAFVSFVLEAGLLSDELTSGNRGCTITCVVNPIDARQLASQGSAISIMYTSLHAVRNDAAEAMGALAAYDSSAMSSTLQGHLLALQGYAEIFLADLYCSGIPLSTLDFNGDYTYQAGSATDAVYQDALAKFAKALPLVRDSVRLLNFVRVGAGRAWLARGQYDSAAAAVAQVPDLFTYQVLVDWSDGQPAGSSLFYTPSSNSTGSSDLSVADREGTNGLDYVSSGDSRTATGSAAFNQYGAPILMPVKYGGATPGVYPATVASGVEARLIEAEAALQHGQYTVWTDKLTRARQLTDASSPAVQDPGASSGDSARISLLFRERAFDLFLTGHRQGDLRRLIRQYHRSTATVYPTGAYPLGGSYGPSVNEPIPPEESANPKFTGCISRGA